MAPHTPNELATSLDIPLSFTNRLLSQFTGAKVEPFTINYARLLVDDVNLSASGQRNYNNGLNNLPLYRTPDENLQFGWSMSHLLRNRAIHIYSYEHLMLCSALGEGFSEKYGAAVWSQIGKKFKEKVEVTPHISQYEALIHGCNGILASTEFGLIVDDRVRLNPYTDASLHCPQSNPLPQPAEFAKAIQTMSDVSNGRQKHATLIGGDVLGWFAAAAEWLVGLTVSISDKDGKQLYATPTDLEPQINIIYVPTTDAQEHLLSQSFDKALQFTARPSIATSTASPSPLPFTGRVTWQSLLPKVFGQSFYRLDHSESATLGNVLGGTARYLECLAATSDASTNPDIISTQNKSNPASWGKGLIETMCTWFPELRRLQVRMERLQRLAFDEADKLCINSIKQLESVCGCDVCSKPSLSPPHQGPKDGFCLPIILETIIALSLSLSRIIVHQGLYPSRAGILSIYHSQVAKRLQTKSVLLCSSDRYKTLFGNEWNANYARRLRNCAALFSGSFPRTDDIPENLVGLSHDGICCYMLLLQKDEGFVTGQGGGEDVIRVVTGGIDVKWKVYWRACWGPPAGMDCPEALGWEEVRCQHLGESLWCK